MEKCLNRRLMKLYKERDIAEKLFDTYESTLYADRLYSHCNESPFGHVSIAFLSLYAHRKAEPISKRAKINETS
jgi:transposase